LCREYRRAAGCFPRQERDRLADDHFRFDVDLARRAQSNDRRLFASILRQPATNVTAGGDVFRRYYDLLRAIGLSTTENLIHPTCMWLMCRIGVPGLSPLARRVDRSSCR
jgi:hypothetical protein